MDLQPIGDRIIVRREASDAKSAGGIILPDAAQKKPQRGTILAVGPGKLNKKSGTRTPLQLKAGDKVLFGKWSGTEVKVDGEDLLIMKESDIMGIIG